MVQTQLMATRFSQLNLIHVQKWSKELRLELLNAYI